MSVRRTCWRPVGLYVIAVTQLPLSYHVATARHPWIYLVRVHYFLQRSESFVIAVAKSCPGARATATRSPRWEADGDHIQLPVTRTRPTKAQHPC